MFSESDRDVLNPIHEPSNTCKKWGDPSIIPPGLIKSEQELLYQSSPERIRIKIPVLKELIFTSDSQDILANLLKTQAHFQVYHIPFDNWAPRLRDSAQGPMMRDMLFQNLLNVV